MIPKIRELIKSASNFTGISPEQIVGPIRDKETVKARRFAIWNAAHIGYSNSQIARALSKHHTSIFHACKVMGLPTKRTAK